MRQIPDKNRKDSRAVFGIRVCLGMIVAGRIFYCIFTERPDILDLLWMLFLMAALLFSIYRFEVLYRLYQESGKLQGVWYAVYFTVSLTFLFYPMKRSKITVTEFKRIIGAGILADYDVNKVVHNFMIWFFWFAVSLFLFCLLANYFVKCKKTKEQQIICDYLSQIIVLANVNLIFRCITYFYDQSMPEKISYQSDRLLHLLILAGLAYFCMKLDQNILPEQYLQLIFCGYAIGYPISVLFCKGSMLIQVQMAAICLLVVLSKKCKAMFQTRKIQCALKGGALTVCLFPFMTSFYLELLHIMNQHHLFVAHPLKYYAVAVVLFFFVIIMVILWVERKDADTGQWRKWSYPCLIFGISCLSVQVPLEFVYDADLFEAANASILISDFLNYGSLPIVEHYGGHMMSGVWEGLLYAFLNQDKAGAIFSPYAGYLFPVLTVLFYYLVTYVWGMDIALWVTLLFPFGSHWSYFGLGMLVCLAVTGYIRKRTYQRAYLVWAAVVWCALYRLDLGYAFGLAGILSLFIYVLCFREKTALKQLLISFAVTVFTGSILWCLLCVWKNVNPFVRLAEFLQISQSNANWAYGSIGNYENTVYAWCYLFVPFMAEAGILYAVCSKKFRDRIGPQRWGLLLMLGISYFVNFSRGLVRHSLAEMSLTVIIWSGYLFLAVFVSLVKENKKLFLVIFSVLILCNQLFLQDKNFTEVSILDTACSKTGPMIESWTLKKEVNGEKEDTFMAETDWERRSSQSEIVSRVKWEETLTERIAPFRTILDTLLEQEETYLDFINHTFVYSAVNRKNPVYVSQSPGHLSGEYTQEQFISQVQKNIDRIPVVLMPYENTGYAAVLDGIANSYRYYKVAEFIYENYKPLCRYGEFAVWCVPERYAQMKRKLEGMGDGDQEEMEYNLINWGYDAALHNYYIGRLPGIWAERDEKQAVKNKIVSELKQKNSCYYMDKPAERQAEGNYLLLSFNCPDKETGNAGDTNAVVKLGSCENGKFDEKYQYEMTLTKGYHNYLIRVSSDYYWGQGFIQAVQIDCDVALEAVTMKILAGD